MPTHAQQLLSHLLTLKPTCCLETNDDRERGQNSQSDGTNYLETNDDRECDQNSQSESVNYMEQAVMDQWGMGGGYKGTIHPEMNEASSASHLTPEVCVLDSAPSYPYPQCPSQGAGM